MPVAPLTTARLVVDVDGTAGTKLGALLATAAILEEDGLWLVRLLLP